MENKTFTWCILQKVFFEETFNVKTASLYSNDFSFFLTDS